MTAKEFLSQAYWLDKRINGRLEMLLSLRDLATKTTAIIQGDVVTHPSRSTCPPWTRSPAR